MKIKKLIKKLKEAESMYGDINVECGSHCGVDRGYIHFDIRQIGSVEDNINWYGDFVLGIDQAKSSLEEVEKGIQDMLKIGYTFYPAQFVRNGDLPRSK